ncbi:POZ domain-containing protein [Lentithecium fluviatile CBS 122367]|uniref:POZ domain-containing protein n=1 Tax=Lentithecium fluviatile CBS 122367 TaxID=1168545 RepID=A0A6G1J976_9PLEO|nr:POZ domain-containing protein [Lentithecium fluviatile CBS 122367]
MAAASAGMFNNPFLSDVTIHQIFNGQSKEYHAHKAVLCAHSEYFMRMFSGSFQEATDRVIELQDDNPIHFEVMLKYMYTLKYEVPSMNELEKDAQFHQTYLLPIGVYALADKYGVSELGTIATDRFPLEGSLIPTEGRRIVEAHYSKCVQADSVMGRVIARKLLRSCRTLITGSAFDDLVKRFPNLAADILLVCSRQSGRLW